MLTIVETTEFTREARNLLDVEEYAELLYYLSQHPDSGNIVKDSGGIRKLRWSAKGKGKRGGVRVIYYYHNKEVPLFALSIYHKSSQTDIRPHARKLYKQMIPLLIKNYGA